MNPLGPIVLAIAVIGWPVQDREALLQRAQEAVQAGEYATAIEIYEAALVVAPGDMMARFGRGQANFLAGNIQTALPDLEAARDASGGSGAVQYILGQAYLELERFSEADMALAAAARERPGFGPLMMLRADICYRLGRMERAESRLREVARVAPEWDLPLARLAELSLARDDVEAAAQWLERSLEVRPMNVDTALLLASTRARLGRPDEALATLQEAVRTTPGSLFARLALAERYDRLDRSRALLAEVDEILQRWPDNPVAHMHRARRQYLAGELGAALASADRALLGISGPAPDSDGTADQQGRGDLLPRVLQTRAELLSRLERQAEAVGVAIELVERFPRYPDGHFVLGNLLLASGDSAGRDHLRKFKQLSDARLHRTAGDTYLAGGDLERAGSEYEGALEANADDVGALLGLATVRRRSAAPDQALELLERARLLNPPPVSWYRERILALDGARRRQQALQEWETAAAVLGAGFAPEVWSVVHAGVAGCES